MYRSTLIAYTHELCFFSVDLLLHFKHCPEVR